MQRSVERVDGVRSVEVDLNTGHGRVMFDEGKAATAEALWQAILDSGFTPIRVQIGSDVYEGPKR